MPSEVFANVAESTLAAPALSTDTTLTLLAGAPFPAVGQYRIRLDDSLQQPNGIATRYEINRATFNAGNVINGFRTGADLEGTTAQGWPIGTAVRAIVTAAALAAYRAAGPANLFRYYRAAALSAGASGEVQLGMDNAPDNPLSALSAGAFVCPAAQAGLWYVAGRASITAPNVRLMVQVYQGTTTEVLRGTDMASAAQVGAAVGGLVRMTAGTSYYLYAYVGAAATFEVGPEKFYFHGFRVGD